MKLANGLFCLMLFLSGTSFAQENSQEKPQEENIDVGVGTTFFQRSEAQIYQVTTKYAREDGLIVPVSVGIGDGLQQYLIGIGYSLTQTNNLIAYSISAALTNTRFDHRYDLLAEDRSRMNIILQQEVVFQLSKRIKLGFNLNLDPVNAIRLNVEQQKTYIHDDWFYSNGQYYDSKGVWKTTRPDFATKEEYEKSVSSKKLISQMSFGISLKFNLHK